MSEESLIDFGKSVFQIYDPHNDFQSLYATSLSYEDFKALVKEFGSAPKPGVYISPNDGSFEKFARDRGKDVVQLDPEGFVDWVECENPDLLAKGVDVKGEE
jgi:hypothetical protein